MPRPLRIEYPGAIYHVMNRGDQRDDIFKDDHDRARFLATLGEACEKTDWQVHAWCLMRNHFHLVVETPKANLVPGMKWFLGTYTLASTAGTNSSVTFSAAATKPCSWMAPVMAISKPSVLTSI